MHYVKQEVLTIDVIDVAVVVIRPVRRPRIDQLERVTAIDDHRLGNVYDLLPLHVEAVLVAEVGAELIVRNASTAVSRVLVPVTIISLDSAIIVVHGTLLLFAVVIALLLFLRTSRLGLVRPLVLTSGVRGVVSLAFVWAG